MSGPLATGLAQGPDSARELSDAVTAAAAWCRDRAWVGLVAFAVVLGVAAARAGWLRRADRMLQAGAQQVTIAAPPQVDPAGITAFWAAMAALLTRGRWRLWRPRPHVAWEYRWAGRELTIVLWVPGTVKVTPVLAAIRGAWPGVTVSATDAGPALSRRQGGPVAASAGTALVPVMPAWYRLLTDHDTDPLRAVVAAASGLKDNESACADPDPPGVAAAAAAAAPGRGRAAHRPQPRQRRRSRLVAQRGTGRARAADQPVAATAPEYGAVAAGVAGRRPAA
ncbi:hypothetical protein ACFQY4_18235 [Catellatospora bangladeshensis]|uniref:hypothetical protein n=1 Tax=Catellatospora bangladeshensis TaxID=310355 RepID=UPI0036107C08